MYSTVAALAGYLLLINAVAVVLFALDKQRARSNARRIPEANLLLSALLGGTPGAYWARATYRHKTQKQPFSTYLHVIAGAQILALIWLAVQMVRALG